MQRGWGGAATGAGVLYGLNASSAGIVCWDRWAQDNHNSVILGRSGGGKSYLAKLDILRSLYQQVQVAVIDPEDEYARLAAAAAGTRGRLRAGGGPRHPVQPPPPRGRGARRRGAAARATRSVGDLISPGERRASRSTSCPASI